MRGQRRSEDEKGVAERKQVLQVVRAMREECLADAVGGRLGLLLAGERVVVGAHVGHHRALVGLHRAHHVLGVKHPRDVQVLLRHVERQVQVRHRVLVAQLRVVQQIRTVSIVQRTF